MSEKRFTWKTEKLQHSDDEVLLVVDNANEEWKGHILNIVDLLNELNDENKELKYKLRNCEDARKSYKQDWKACSSYCDEYKNEIISLKDEVEGLIGENKELKIENEQLRKKLEQIYSFKGLNCRCVNGV